MKVLVAPMIAVMSLLAVPSGAQAQPRDVDLKNRDAMPLKATYYPAGKPGPGVVLLHMCNSDRKAWDNLGKLLAARGIHAIAFDYRGYGESGGQRHADLPPNTRNFLMQDVWPTDVKTAFDYLVAQQGVDGDRIGVAGGSCGVNQAVTFARRHPKVRTMVLLAGNPNPAGQEFLTGASWMPILGVASLDDGAAVPNMRWTVGYSSNPASTLKEYQSGGHGTELFAVHKDLEPAIVDWFDQHLIKKLAVPDLNAKPGPSGALGERLRQPGGPAQLLEELRQARAAGRAFALPPEGVLNGFGLQLQQEGRPQDAVPVYALSIEAYPKSFAGHIGMAQAKFAQRDYEGASASHRKAIELGDPGYVVHNDLGSALLYMGRKEEALKSYEKAVAIATAQGQAGHGNFLLARAYARLGEKDRAFELLEKAIALGFINRGAYENDPHLAPIRTDARFQQVLARIPAQ